MSVTVSNCFQIHNSPLNQSSAKALWSFPKSDRFDKIGTYNPNNCARAFYDLPSVTDSRKASIGYGKKYDLTKQSQNNPAPNTYNPPDEITTNKVKSRGFQFGVGREKMPQQGILGGVNKLTPGPGNYELGSTLSSQKWSMRPRTQGDLMILNKFVPGPGTYQDVPAINTVGRYTLSKFGNSCATTFNPPRSKRFSEDKLGRQVPGPGNYAVEKTGIQKDGRYFLSNLRSSKCRSFPHDMRRTGSMGHFEKTPGPGSYRLPSDFGIYESKNKEQFLSKSSEKIVP